MGKWLLLGLIVLGACAPVQNPPPQAILSSDPLVYLPEAWVEARTLRGGVEEVRLRTFYSRTLGELQDELARGFQSSRIQLKCSELVGLGIGGGPYLHLRLAASPDRDLTLRIVPLDGYWPLGHSLFQVELRRVPSRFGLGCPLD